MYMQLQLVAVCEMHTLLTAQETEAHTHIILLSLTLCYCVPRGTVYMYPKKCGTHLFDFIWLSAMAAILVCLVRLA